MEQFQNLYPVAELLDCMPYVEQMEKTASAIESQRKTVVVVTGMRSSGKTTAVNRMVGSEVREPGNMDDEEKPLRVSFEPMGDDERYQCVLMANREWNSRDALIFEFREENICQESQLTEEIMAADKVFFLISATAPFNRSEVSLLKKMKTLDCQVIVNGIDNVKESDRQQVMDYIAKINDSLDLPSALYMEESDADFGRKIRNALPGYEEQEEKRRKRIDSIVQSTVLRLNEILKKQTAELEKKKDREADDFRIKKVKADCYTIRMDIEDCKGKAIRKVADSLDGAVSAMVAAIARKYADEPMEKIQKAAEKEYENKAVSAISVLQECCEKDLQKVKANAALLGIPNLDITECDLRKHLMADPKKRMEKVKDASAQSQNSTKILIGTAVIAGGFLLAPIPTIANIAGAAVSAGVGGNMYIKEKKEEKEKGLEASLKAAFSSGMENIKGLVTEQADLGYGEITKALQKSENEFVQALALQADDGTAEKLKRAAELLKDLI